MKQGSYIVFEVGEERLTKEGEWYITKDGWVILAPADHAWEKNTILDRHEFEGFTELGQWCLEGSIASAVIDEATEKATIAELAKGGERLLDASNVNAQLLEAAERLVYLWANDGDDSEIEKAQEKLHAAVLWE